MSSRNLPNCHCERSVAISSPQHRPLPQAVASPAPPPLQVVRPHREPPNVIAKPAQLSLRAQRGNLVAAARTLPASRRITPPHPPTTPAKIADTHAKRERTPVLYPIHQSDRRTPAGRRNLVHASPSAVPGARERPVHPSEHNIGNIGSTVQVQRPKTAAGSGLRRVGLQLAASHPLAVLFNGTGARWRGGCDLRPVSALALAAKAGTWKLGTGISQTTLSGRGADNLDPKTRSPMFNPHRHPPTVIGVQPSTDSGGPTPVRIVSSRHDCARRLVSAFPALGSFPAGRSYLANRGCDGRAPSAASVPLRGLKWVP